MELRYLQLPSGGYYGLFSQEELAEIDEIRHALRESIRERMERHGYLDHFAPTPPPLLEEARLNNRLRAIEQAAIARV